MRDSVFEIHYWSTEGRILIVHIPNFGIWADVPILTELMVLSSTGSVKDASFAVASALADGGNPAGGLVEHDSVGAVHVIREQSATFRAEGSGAAA